jgi:septum formation topological specificity factor MinE
MGAADRREMTTNKDTFRQMKKFISLTEDILNIIQRYIHIQTDGHSTFIFAYIPSIKYMKIQK